MINNSVARAIACIAAAGLYACTSVQSVSVGGANDSRLGQVYFLPTTLLPISVAIHSTQPSVVVAAGQPKYVADERHRYRLKSIYSAFHAETFETKVNEAGLLTNLTHESDGRLDETFVGLAKSVGAFVPESFTLTQTDLDPVFNDEIDVAVLLDPTKLAELNAVINASLASAIAASGNMALKSAALKNSNQIVTLSVSRGSSPATEAERADDAGKCGEGLCYRKLIRYKISAQFFDGSNISHSVYLPNGSPIYAAAVRRGAFAKWSTTAVLSNGILLDYKLVTDASEAEAAVILPFEMLGAFFAGLTKQGENLNSRATLEESRIALEEKRADVEKRRAELNTESYNFAQSSNQKLLFSMVGGPSIRMAPNVGSQGIVIPDRGVTGSATNPNTRIGNPSGRSSSGSTGTGGN